MQSADILEKRIGSREATIGVMGLGYVGLPLALACAQARHHVLGFDISQEKVDGVNAGASHITDVSADELRVELAAGRLRATTQAHELQACDAILICVPTPLNKTKEPDVSFIVRALEEVRRFLRRGQLIVLESTTYPGFTREVALPTLEETEHRVGQDFFLAFSPERTDPGNLTYGVTNTTKVLGGCTATCTEVASALYQTFVSSLHVVSSPDAAEMAKLLENTFRAVNIGLVNEMALMCHRLGIDTWEVIEAARTKPFGFMPFYPGPGLGGHCIPVDPLYLSWKLRSHNYTARFIEMAQTVNAAMPAFVVRMVIDALNDHSKALRGARVAVFGVAYKADVADIRESPALEIIHLLERQGADLCYVDPHVPELQLNGLRYTATEGDSALADTDCVVITTAHAAFDLAKVVARAPLVVDTRNATRGVTMTEAQRAKVYRL